jgi:hypothetical protein
MLAGSGHLSIISAKKLVLLSSVTDTCPDDG